MPVNRTENQRDGAVGPECLGYIDSIGETSRWGYGLEVEEGSWSLEKYKSRLMEFNRAGLRGVSKERQWGFGFIWKPVKEEPVKEGRRLKRWMVGYRGAHLSSQHLGGRGRRITSSGSPSAT